MSNNIATLEQLLNDLTAIDGVQGSLGASISWSYCASLANATAARYRLDDPADPLRQRLSAEQLDERQANLETRIDELTEVIAWAAAFAAVDYRPTGESVLERLTSDLPSVQTDAQAVKEIAELFDLTEEEAQAAAAKDAAARQAEAVVQQQALIQARASLTKAIDFALDAHVDQDYDLADHDARRIAERIAEKCETYEDQRRQRAFRTRRARVRRELAGEAKLLVDVMNRADEVALRLGREIEAQGPEANVA